MDRHFRPYLCRQDTVYGVEELPEEETAADAPLPPPFPLLDPGVPSTSTGVTVPPTGLILSHAQIHISTDSSSDYSAVREAIKDGKYEASVEETELGVTSVTAENATELELLELRQESTPETDSAAPCTMSCFCLQKCKKSKENKGKEQAGKVKPPAEEKF